MNKNRSESGNRFKKIGNAFFNAVMSAFFQTGHDLLGMEGSWEDVQQAAAEQKRREEQRKIEFERSALQLESAVLEALQRPESKSVTDAEQLAIQTALFHVRSTPRFIPVIEPMRYDPNRVLIERRQPKLVEPLAKNDQSLLLELGTFITEHGLLGKLTQFVFLADKKIPTYLDVAVFHRESGSKRYTFIITEQVPTVANMDQFVQELADKGITKIFSTPIKLAQEGNAFAFGEVSQGTYEQFSLWNSFPIEGKTYFAFLSIHERSTRPPAKKRSVEKQRRERRLSGLIPQPQPARN